MKARGMLSLLACLGFAQMVADLAGLPRLAAAAAAAGASPAPRVFSSVRGLETFSSRFFVEWRDTEGRLHAVAITPERARGLAGPYNRRNVFGATLAYGPVLASDPRTRDLFHSVARASLCGEAPLLAELGIETPGRSGPPRLRVEPRTPPDAAPWPTVLEASCP